MQTKKTIILPYMENPQSENNTFPPRIRQEPTLCFDTKDQPFHISSWQNTLISFVSL